MKINSQNLNQFRKDFEDAIKQLEEQYNVNIKLGNITYDDNSFRGKLEVTNKGFNTYEEEFNKYHKLFGFEKEDLHKVIKIGGTKFEFIGLNMSNKSKVCILKRDDNQLVKSDPYTLKEMFNAKV